jgi:hypothetical protein
MPEGNEGQSEIMTALEQNGRSSHARFWTSSLGARSLPLHPGCTSLSRARDKRRALACRPVRQLQSTKVTQRIVRIHLHFDFSDRKRARETSAVGCNEPVTPGYAKEKRLSRTLEFQIN